MVRISTLNDALKTMFNAEKRGKKQVLIRPVSKVIIKFLQVMQRHGEHAGVIIIFGPGRLRVGSAGGACAAAPAVAQGSSLVKPAHSAGGERASA